MTFRQKAKQNIKADIQEYHHDEILDYIEDIEYMWVDNLFQDWTWMDDCNEWDITEGCDYE